MTWAGCQAPIHATLRRPLCVLRGNFFVPDVSLRREVYTPASSDTLHSLSLGNGDDINHLVLRKYTGDIYLLLEMFFCPIDFVCNRTSVDLDLHQMCLL